MRATCPAQIIPLVLITVTVLGDGPRYVIPSVLSFSFFWGGPNILLSTLFLHNLILSSSFGVRDQVSCPYKTGKSIVLYMLTSTLLERTLEEDGV
jgi:hypothetical protein